jgi:protein tyrosine phosphatase (PTP) superfamily phosphohydrolase (DUF442 family)
MTIMQWFRSGRSARGTPASRRSIQRPAPLVLVALIGLTQMGCQSGFFGPCGPCSSVRNWRARVFNRGAGGCGPAGCGPAVTSEVPVEGAAPGAIVTPAPGAIVTPAPGGGPALPGPAESTPAPQLEAIPSATPGPPSEAGPAPSGAKAPTGKINNYEAARPRSRAGRLRNDPLSGALVQTPEPTTRSAQGSAPAPKSELDLVGNLPPLELPHEEQKPTATPTPAPADSTVIPTAPSPAEVNVAPIARFTALEGRLSGGALPTPAGLDWLVEKGYKTVLDLREPGEVQPSFITEVTNRGLRYLPLPISVKTVDKDHLSHFNLELSMADARPLYFFDTDGVRAGVLWYIRRLAVDKVDPQVASREAEDLGLSKPNKDFWLAAQAYLERLNAAKPAAPPRAAPESAPVPSSTPAPESKASAAPASAPTPAQGSPTVPNATPKPSPTGSKPEASIVPLDTLLNLETISKPSCSL